MSDISTIEEFENSWTYIRQMTDSFIKCVPDDKWNFTHHQNFAPLVKQFKHVVKVYSCYVDAIPNRKLNMSLKKSMFSGPETRENILASLHGHDEQLKKVLNDLKKTGLDGYRVDVFGMSMSFNEYVHVMIQHEVGHFGIWANYAAFGNFQTPEGWRADWKL